jgi:DNA ligase-1
MAKSVMLAPNDKVDFKDLKYPQLISRKYDGLRMVVKSGELYTRNWNFVPNDRLIKILTHPIASISEEKSFVFDGEFYSHEVTFQQIVRVASTRNAVVDASYGYYIFDVLTKHEWVDENEPVYYKRRDRYLRLLEKYKISNVFPVEQYLVTNAEQARNYYEQFVEEGYEGAMVRNIEGKYKHGRARVSQNLIFKFKSLLKGTGRIIEVLEGLREDRLAGYAGSIRVVMPDGVETKLMFSRGFNMYEKKRLWEKRDTLLGKTAEIEYIAVGNKLRPRSGRVIRII